MGVRSEAAPTASKSSVKGKGRVKGRVKVKGRGKGKGKVKGKVGGKVKGKAQKRAKVYGRDAAVKAKAGKEQEECAALTALRKVLADPPIPDAHPPDVAGYGKVPSGVLYEVYDGGVV
eukprot:gene15993-22287_t